MNQMAHIPSVTNTSAFSFVPANIATTVCPDNGLAVGMRIHFDGLVNGFSLLCRFFTPVGGTETVG